jgi:predicted alpha/beta superfamily hydrolase
MFLMRDVSGRIFTFSEIIRIGYLQPTHRSADQKYTHFRLHPSETQPRGSTAQEFDSRMLPIVTPITAPFDIPRPIRTRRITALLPHDYHNTDRRYPVLYLQDGQNLFDDFAPFGSWELRRQLARMAQRGMADLIIVAIDHAEEERIAEFTPSQKTQLGVGEGKKYAHFLARILKPHVDELFRTLPDPGNTGIGGSSMGGLVSIYAVTEHPGVYSRLMIFSPSLWVIPSYPELFNRRSAFTGRIYLYGGEREGEELIGHLKNFHATLEENPNRDMIDVKMNIRSDGEHNERAWGAEFPAAIQWLYFSEGVKTARQPGT